MSGVPLGTLRNPHGMEVRSMVKGDGEQIAARVAQRARFRLHHVGTKLNERELCELGPVRAKRGPMKGPLSGFTLQASLPASSIATFNLSNLHRLPGRLRGRIPAFLVTGALAFNSACP